MKKWFTFFFNSFFKKPQGDFYYHQELKSFEAHEDSRRTEYLSSFSKAA